MKNYLLLFLISFTLSLKSQSCKELTDFLKDKELISGSFGRCEFNGRQISYRKLRRSLRKDPSNFELLLSELKSSKYYFIYRNEIKARVLGAMLDLEVELVHRLPLTVEVSLDVLSSKKLAVIHFPKEMKKDSICAEVVIRSILLDHYLDINKQHFLELLNTYITKTKNFSIFQSLEDRYQFIEIKESI